MTDQSPTERLRAMLDECGANYREYHDINGKVYVSIDIGIYNVLLTLRCTPEQAIAATLGEQHATAELQSLSKLKMAGRLRYWRGTIEIPEVELHAICDQIQTEHEQAIAATLGSDDAYTREDCEAAFVRGYSLGSLPAGSDPQWDENRQTVDEHMAELGWVRAATLGSGADETEQMNGRLTAEQVREAIERHVEFYEGGDYDEQAIADELNAAMGNGTCEMETDHDELELIASSHEDTWGYRCSACGWVFRYDRGIKSDYCPNCGRKVVSE